MSEPEIKPVLSTFDPAPIVHTIRQKIAWAAVGGVAGLASGEIALREVAPRPDSTTQSPDTAPEETQVAMCFWEGGCGLGVLAVFGAVAVINHVNRSRFMHVHRFKKQLDTETPHWL